LKEEITRFAPSPTGHLHIGGARTALFSWLFARSKKGKFLLRFEDTDKERSKKEFEESIISSLSWLGIEPDEKPIYQSKNIKSHQKEALNLLESGKAYSCDCSPEQLSEMREKQIKNKLQPKYDGLNREKNISHKEGNVIRFKMPQSGKTVFEDQILGPITVENKELDDFIILRGDGSPTYNFSAALDDKEMKITTVIRGDDHITNTLKQINILKALEEELPQYAHLPMVLSNSGKRLSKRDGAADITDYRKGGYLKEAIINYLVKLGWSYSDQEIFSKEELVSLFNLSAVNSSPAKFSEELINFYNNYYLNLLDVKNLYELIDTEYEVSFNIKSNDKYLDILNLVREGAKTVLDLIDQIKFFYEVPCYEEQHKELITSNIEVVKIFSENIENIDFNNQQNLENDLKSFLSSKNLKFPQLGKPLRLILSGRQNAPSISQLLFFLGEEESLKRINFFLD
jgi:glutamyl-tRNA synthetase